MFNNVSSNIGMDCFAIPKKHSKCGCSLTAESTSGSKINICPDCNIKKSSIFIPETDRGGAFRSTIIEQTQCFDTPNAKVLVAYGTGVCGEHEGVFTFTFVNSKNFLIDPNYHTLNFVGLPSDNPIAMLCWSRDLGYSEVSISNMCSKSSFNLKPASSKNNVYRDIKNFNQKIYLHSDGRIEFADNNIAARNENVTKDLSSVTKIQATHLVNSTVLKCECGCSKKPKKKCNFSGVGHASDLSINICQSCFLKTSSIVATRNEFISTDILQSQCFETTGGEKAFVVYGFGRDSLDPFFSEPVFFTLILVDQPDSLQDFAVLNYENLEQVGAAFIGFYEMDAASITKCEESSDSSKNMISRNLKNNKSNKRVFYDSREGQIKVIN